MKFGKYFTPWRVFGCTCKMQSNWKLFHLIVKYSPFTRKFIYRSHLPSKPIFQTLKPEERKRELEGKVTNSDHPTPNSVRSRRPILLHASLISHTKPKPKHGEIGCRRSPDCHPQPTTLPSCMQAPRFGSDRLLTISSLPPITNLVTATSRSTHPWPIASISFSICLSFFLNHSLFLPPFFSLKTQLVSFPSRSGIL